MRHLRLLGHQDDVPLAAHRGGQRLVLFRVARAAEKRIHHDESAAVVRQAVQQLGMQGAVPGLSARLVELVERRVVHQDERDLVGDRMGTEAEQVVIAGVHPGIAQRRQP